MDGVTLNRASIVQMYTAVKRSKETVLEILLPCENETEFKDLAESIVHTEIPAWATAFMIRFESCTNDIALEKMIRVFMKRIWLFFYLIESHFENDWAPPRINSGDFPK